MKVNAYHIDKIISAGFARQLAAFILMKSKFKNSCYYNYSRNSVAKKCSGISGPNAGRYINFFLDNNWCVEHCGNLVFKSIGKVAEFYDNATEANKKEKFHRKAINLIKCKGQDINSVLFQIRLTVVKQKYNQFRKSKLQWSESINPENSTSYAKAKKYIEKYKISNYSENSRYFVSVKTLSKRLKISPSNVVVFIKEAIAKGRATKLYIPPRVIKVPGLTEMNKDVFKYPSNTRDYKFMKNGFVAHYYCNSYTFS